jgi:hypothetical protein
VDTAAKLCWRNMSLCHAGPVAAALRLRGFGQILWYAWILPVVRWRSGNIMERHDHLPFATTPTRFAIQVHMYIHSVPLLYHLYLATVPASQRPSVPSPCVCALPANRRRPFGACCSIPRPLRWHACFKHLAPHKHPRRSCDSFYQAGCFAFNVGLPCFASKQRRLFGFCRACLLDCLPPGGGEKGPL